MTDNKELRRAHAQLDAARARLTEIFMNLVDNGAKFMSDEPVPRVEIGVEQAGEDLVLHVRDNGIWIDPQVSRWSSACSISWIPARRARALAWCWCGGS